MFNYHGTEEINWLRTFLCALSLFTGLSIIQRQLSQSENDQRNITKLINSNPFGSDKLETVSIYEDEAALVQVMAWRRTGDKSLAAPMLTQFNDAYMWQMSLTTTSSPKAQIMFFNFESLPNFG